MPVGQQGPEVASLIVAVTIGFLLGILLMIFLMAGREEEDLLDRLEAAESSRVMSPRGSEGPREAAGNERAENIPPR